MYSKVNTKGAKPHLYLIDSGIDFSMEQSLSRRKITIEQIDIVRQTQNEVFSCRPSCGCHNEHGDIIAHTIYRLVDFPIHLLSLRILDDCLRAHSEELLEALSYIYRRGEPGVVNLSLGTVNLKYERELKKIISQLKECGIYTVCAAGRERALPAALEEVITVSDLKMYQNDRERTVCGETIDLVVDIDKFALDTIPYSSTSFAAPFAAACTLAVLNYKRAGSLEEIKRELLKIFSPWK